MPLFLMIYFRDRFFYLIWLTSFLTSLLNLCLRSWWLTIRLLFSLF